MERKNLQSPVVQSYCTAVLQLVFDLRYNIVRRKDSKHVVGTRATITKNLLWQESKPYQLLEMKMNNNPTPNFGCFG